jgi:hypothetical protein
MRTKRKPFVLGIGLWLLLSLSASGQETVRVATYNIYGTVYKLTPSGTLTTLCQFDGANGKYAAALIQGLERELL